MNLSIVRMEHEHFDKLISQTSIGVAAIALEQAYFSPGSVALCMRVDEEPVFAGGIVNLQWHRGEAWILPTPFFRHHVKTCYKNMRDALPKMAARGGFRRIQATCSIKVSPSLFQHLGFYHEGTLNGFGPNGETCFMYARLFI